MQGQCGGCCLRTAILKYLTMKRNQNLDSIGKKARLASGKLNCTECPAKAKCTPVVFDVCTYAFDVGFRKGYNQRKREMQCKKS